jgi:uncharacterized membrane protein
MDFPVSDSFSQLARFARGHHRALLIGLMTLIGVVCALISLPNHYFFRTYAYDLGIFNNAIYDYAHFRWNSNSVKLYNNILSDHFTLLHIPFSVFYWIWGTYTLLIIQILAILFGAYGAYRYQLFRSGDPLFALLLTAQFLFIWGIYSAVSYDYHDNIPGAMMVPWLFLFFEQRKWRWAALFYVLLLVSKENMALWAVFICLGMAALHYKDKKQLKYALLGSALAAIYFVVVIKVIVPALAPPGRVYWYISNYSAIGNGFGEIFLNAISHPRNLFTLLFENQLDFKEGYGLKTELHWFVLLSGGIALFYRPVFLLMLLPIYAQKMFISNMSMWGVYHQYSIEFVPILNLALGNALLKVPRKWILPLASVATLFTLVTTISLFDKRPSLFYYPVKFRFYQAIHWQQRFDVAKMHDDLDKYIPKNAAVSAQCQLVPHLAMREYIYEFPVIRNAEYIAVLLGEMTHPLYQSDFDLRVREFKKSPDWKIIYEENDLIILKRLRWDKHYPDNRLYE